MQLQPKLHPSVCTLSSSLHSWTNICWVPKLNRFTLKLQTLDELTMSKNYRLLVKNAKQVVLVCGNGEKYLTNDGMQNLCVIENGSIVIGR